MAIPNTSHQISPSGRAALERASGALLDTYKALAEAASADEDLAIIANFASNVQDTRREIENLLQPLDQVAGTG